LKVYIASDHAGFELKEKITQYFKDYYDFEDLGPNTNDRVDYPDFAIKLSQKINRNTNKNKDQKINQDSLGILVCGSGQGVCMTANKFSHIRAALCTNEELAELSRAHNNANVLCLGSRTVSDDLNLKIVKRFLTTEFEGGRHQARVDKMSRASLKESL